MYTIDQLNRILESDFAGLPLDHEPSGLYQPIRYIMEDGGKRMRPLLTLLSANLYSDDIQGAMASAVAVEVFHNFTLLHDDIMDRATMRRSRQTVHCKWNENTAILSGDAMMIIGNTLLCERSPERYLKRLLEVYNRASIEVCKGQQYDMEFETRPWVEMSEYIQMIGFKTASLMAASLEMGAITSGANIEQCRAIYEFGINLGIAFQIQDDLLDTYGNSATFGKAIGGDIAVGKKTFLQISAIQVADIEQQTILRASRDYDQVRALYDTLGVQVAAQTAINDYFQRALVCLEKCHSNAARLEPLTHYAHQLMKREK